MPSQGPAAIQRRCPHPVRQVLEFNVLGVVVGCVLCDCTFDMTGEEAAQFVEFTHTSARGREYDLYLLVAQEQITE